jgi:hypothetical protein
MRFVGRRVVVAVAALAATVGFLAMSSSAAVASGAPYTDPNAVGTIGLCDQTGQPLTHGDLETKPFAWKAVGASAGPTPFNQTGATAQLYAFQPRKGVDPGDWSGEQLSGASRFANLAHPTAALTGLDESLAVFVGHFPPDWNGYIQLRLYLNAPNAGEYTSTYNALNIVVKGNTWSVASADAAPPCGGSTAVSDKQVLATSSAAAASLTTQTLEGSGGTTPSPKAGQKSTRGSGSTGGATDATAQGAAASGPGVVVPAPSGSPVSGGSSAATDGSTAAGASASHGSSSHALLWILVGVAIIGVGLVGVQWVRSRS